MMIGNYLRLQRRRYSALNEWPYIHRPSLAPCSALFAKRWHSGNKFDRFRVRMNSLAESQNLAAGDDSLAVAQGAFAVLAKKGRTWRRLGHLVEMACDEAKNLHNCALYDLPSIVDVGCDHGLLAIGLAASGRFGRVIGTDVSARALEDGALANYANVVDVLATAGSPELPVDFRVCNGLQCLDPGEADAICIAGMGVNTMIKIIFPSIGKKSVLDYLKCERMFLQPTNSKPRNLMRLYAQLQRKGWSLKDERIMYLASRWYVSAEFSYKETSQEQLPGTVLRSLPTSDGMGRIYQDYVDHHAQWIKRDMVKKGGVVLEDEARWLAVHQIRQ